MSRSKVRITVLKRQDPKEIFEEYPVAEKDWFVPCGLFSDGQEFILEENLANAGKILHLCMAHYLS